MKWISDHLLISGEQLVIVYVPQKNFNVVNIIPASRDSSMALWSIDSADRNQNALAEEVSQIEPIFQFSNLSSPSHRRSTSGERVRSLAYDKHNYVCVISTP